MIEAGQDFAITELETRPLTPTVKLLIAQRHRISGWVLGAVRALVMRPPTLFSLAEYELLGYQNVYIIDKVRTQIQHHRLCVAFHSPNILHEEMLCVHKEACGEAWDTAWWGGFAKHYLHPDMPATPKEALADLLNADIPGVTYQCHINTVGYVDSKGVLKKENEFIMAAITEMTA